MQSPYTTKIEIVQIGRKMAERRMASGTGGNISARMSDGSILITPAGRPKGELLPEELVLLDSSGKKLSGNQQGSSEKEMHLHVYRQRADVMACVHSHPPFATAFAVAGIEIDSALLPELVLFVGPIPLTDYAPPGTDAVARSLEPHLETANAFLLRNHGLLTIGRTISEAWLRHETVEHAAEVLHHARLLGSMHKIPGDDLQRLEAMRKRLDETWGSRS